MNKTEPSRIDRLFRKSERSGLSSLTQSERFCFGVFWLFREVNNGGFHNFFFNDAGQFALDAMTGLERIGAVQTADILRRAMKVFPESEVPVDQETRRALLTSLPEEIQWGRLSELSDEFFVSDEAVADLLSNYISNNPGDYPVFMKELEEPPI